MADVRFGLRPATAKHTALLLFRGTRPRNIATLERQGVLEHGNRDARANCFQQTIELGWCQRRWLGRDQAIEGAHANRGVQVDWLDFVLFGQFVNKWVFFNLLKTHPLHHRTTHQPCVGGDNADPFSLATCDRVDRSNQFVLDGDSVFKRWHGDFFKSSPECGPHDQLFLLKRSFLANHSCDRFDSKTIGCQGGFVTEKFDVVVQVDFDLASLAAEFF